MAPLISVLFLAAGCGKNDVLDRSLSPAQAKNELDQAFQSASNTARRNVEVAIKALDADKYDKAYVAISAVQADPEISYDQAVATRHAMHTLQERLARGVVRGDPEALEAAKVIRRMQR